MFRLCINALTGIRVRRRQEATKFKAAMADPEFQSMLRDYMEEMQDPAQRAVNSRSLSAAVYYCLLYCCMVFPLYVRTLRRCP